MALQPSILRRAFIFIPGLRFLHGESLVNVLIFKMSIVRVVLPCMVNVYSCFVASNLELRLTQKNKSSL